MVVRRKIESVAFVIPARNEERYLKECLDSIAAQGTGLGLVLSSLVVDNGSSDRTSDIATASKVTVLKITGCNPAKARNIGARNTQSDVIVFVDADCVLPKGWLEKGVQFLEQEDCVGFGAAQAIPPKGSPWVERIWVDSIVPQKQIEHEKAAWLPAFNLMVWREAFEAVGGFDESLETCEDSDLSFRLSSRGALWKDYRFPVRHLGESQTLSQFLRREMWRSRGNLSSAMKRGTTMNEVVSIFVPIFYVVLFVLTIGMAVGLPWTSPTGRFIFGGLVVLTVGVPTCIAISKFGPRHLVYRSLLLATYLFGRGIGPFWRWERVSR
jgi:glycosyltransferase involved in cell wall biosynthesis